MHVRVASSTAVQMDTMTPAAATGAIHAGAGDAVILEKPLGADVAEVKTTSRITGVPLFHLAVLVDSVIYL